ncbi:MAG: arsenate reductase (glutaredoxin) [Kangiellaceae bacterium]|jgi:arsenate reductase (glutaredoxin)
MAQYTILHNPRCSKSRQTLALLEENGLDFEVLEYLKTPPTQKQLKTILSLLDAEPRDIMRKGEAEYKESGLNDDTLSKAEQVKLMVAFPKVIERPIVFSQQKAIVGRPPENVLKLV